MSSSESPAPRRRLSREDRLRQLLDVAWQLVRDEGTDALTLGRLAELAGVTKPVVYDHFAARAGVLAALYADFDERQDQVFADAIATSNAFMARTWCADVLDGPDAERPSAAAGGALRSRIRMVSAGVSARRRISV